MFMKIAVLIKQVPDSWAEKSLTSDTFLLDRDSSDKVLNDLDEYAIEQALAWQENDGAELVAICMGPESAADAIRRALSMGVDSGIHINDEALKGSDAIATSRVLAAAIVRGGFDLVISGVESTDARMGVVPAMLSELLEWPQLTFANRVAINGSNIEIDRVTENGISTLTATLPAIVSVVEKINEPRYPNFKGIMAAKKKTVEMLTCADLGISDVGLASAWSVVSAAKTLPPRAAGIKVVDESGSSVAALVDFLAERKVI